jgi:NAD(P)-dependent dehydrogenase (short-subunit alcohol dehydrogenase family)
VVSVLDREAPPSPPELMRKDRRDDTSSPIGAAEDVASAILYLTSAASGTVTGHTLPVDGGFLEQ